MEQEFYQQGMTKTNAQDYAGAIQAFDRAIERDPESATAYYQRGRARFHLGDIDWAIADYSIALRLDPQNASFYFGRSLAYLSQGTLPAAIADARQVTQLNPSHAGAYRLLGTACQKLGQMEMAITCYKQAAELYLAQQDVENCRHCLSKAQQLKPPVPVAPPVEPLAPIDPQAYLNEALLKAKSGNAAEAIADLDWAIQINPDDAAAYGTRGQVYAKLGDYHSAHVDYQTAARLYGQQGDRTMQQTMQTAMQRLSSPQKSPAFSESRTTRWSGTTKTTSSGRVSREVQVKLMRLVGNDRTLVSGLVEQLKRKHPGMSEDWYWEKAIYDLERDRR